MDALQVFRDDPLGFVDYAKTLSPTGARVALKQMLPARLHGDHVPPALIALWKQMAKNDPVLGSYVVKNLLRLAEGSSRSIAILNAAWKVGYSYFSPKSPPPLMHFMATAIPQVLRRDARILDFICQCIHESGLDLQNRLSLLIPIARESKLVEIWENHVVARIPPDNERFMSKVAKVLIAEELPVQLKQLYRLCPEKFFAASLSMPRKCDVVLPEPYKQLREFARTLVLPEDMTAFCDCTYEAFDALLHGVVEEVRRQIDDIPEYGRVKSISSTIDIAESIEFLGLERERARKPGYIDSLVTCFRIMEKLFELHGFDSKTFENARSRLDNWEVQFTKAAAKCAVDIMQGRTQLLVTTRVSGIHVFGRLGMDRCFDSVCRLLGDEDVPISELSKITASCIRFLNCCAATNDAHLVQRCLESINCVISAMPVFDENTQKLVATACKTYSRFALWTPPDARESWHGLVTEHRAVAGKDKTNLAYLLCYESGVGEENEKGASALYNHLLHKDKRLIWPASSYVSTDYARKGLLQFVDKYGSEIPKHREILAKIMCGQPIPESFPLIGHFTVKDNTFDASTLALIARASSSQKPTKESRAQAYRLIYKNDVILASHQLESQGRFHEAGLLARVETESVAEQYRTASLTRDRKLFTKLERLTHPVSFDIAFWRMRAHEAFDIPTSIDSFWSLADTPMKKIRALLYIAKRDDTSGPGALAAALKCLDLLNYCISDINPMMYPTMRKDILKIIVQKYVSVGLSEWAIRYGWKPEDDEIDGESKSLPIVVEDDISDDEMLEIVMNAYHYLMGLKPRLMNDWFGIAELEHIIRQGNAKGVEAAAQQCLCRIWNAYQNLACVSKMREMHQFISYLCSIIAPYCAFVSVGLVYQTRRLQNILENDIGLPPAAVIQEKYCKKATQQTAHSPLIWNQGCFKSCVVFLHFQSTAEVDYLYATRIYAASAGRPQINRSWRVTLPVGTLRAFIDRLYNILESNETSAKQSALDAAENDSDKLRHNFWTVRNQNNDRVKTLLSEFRLTLPWLPWIMNGIPSKGWDQALKMADGDPTIAMMILGKPTLKDIESLESLQYFVSDANAILAASKKWHAEFTRDPRSTPEPCRQPVTLFLDQDLCNIPFEMLPGLDTTPFTREIHCTRPFAQRDAAIANPQTGYYIINPDGSLPSQAELLQVCKTLDWHGRHLEAPPAQEVYSKLSSAPVFLYAGHNGGERLVNMEDIQKGGWTSSVMLMGCHTARTRKIRPGQSFNTCFHYLIGGCPFVLGNLWGVLSNDCDKLCKSVLELWTLSNPVAGVTPHLAAALTMSRKKAKFHYLTGASAVCFGSSEAALNYPL